MLIVVDPGRSGGIVWNEPKVGIRAEPMPKTEREIGHLVRYIVGRSEEPPVAYVEAVTGYIKPDKPLEQPEDPLEAQLNTELRKERQPAHLMFNFGKATGAVIGALWCAGVANVHEVYPRTWQKIYFLNLRGKPQPVRKRILRDAAQRSFPQIKVTYQVADALLIYRFAELAESQNLFSNDDLSRSGFGEPPAKK